MGLEGIRSAGRAMRDHTYTNIREKKLAEKFAKKEYGDNIKTISKDVVGEDGTVKRVSQFVKNNSNENSGGSLSPSSLSAQTTNLSNSYGDTYVSKRKRFLQGV